LREKQFSVRHRQDVLDMAQIAIRARVSGVINIGGGNHQEFPAPDRNPSAHIFKQQIHGHKYAIQIAADGTASRRPAAAAVAFDESLVYGKLRPWRPDLLRKLGRHHRIAIIITALSQTAAKYMKGRRVRTLRLAVRTWLLTCLKLRPR